jgi:hypothetical protein
MSKKAPGMKTPMMGKEQPMQGQQQPQGFGGPAFAQ